MSQKRSTLLAWYNFNVHEPTLVIFGRNVTETVRNKKILIYFPPH